MILNQNMILAPLNYFQKVGLRLNENGQEIYSKIVYERIKTSKTRGTSYLNPRHNGNDNIRLSDGYSSRGRKEI